MKSILLILFLHPVFLVAQAQDRVQKVSSPRFQAMLQSYYEEYIQLNPTIASFKGDYRYNDRLENPIRQSYLGEMKALYTRYLDSLNAFTESQFDSRDRLSYQIMRYDLQRSLQGLQFPTYLTPVNQMSDFQIQFLQKVRAATFTHSGR
jgi:uncharacterized protein (DUF885 family)